MEIGTVLGMHGPEYARHTSNGWHISALSVRQADDTRAATSHAVKPFGPLIGHLAIPFSAPSYDGKPDRRYSKKNTS
jgi:hypothetical protein